MARTFIILYALMGIYYMSVSAHVQEARSVDLNGQDSVTFFDYTDSSSNNSRETRAVLSREPSSCGWYVEFSGSTDIIYKIPDGVEHVSCIWVVWPKTSGPIRVRNVANSQAHFDSSFRLTLEKNFAKTTSTSQTNLRLGSEDNVTFNSNHEYNFFYIFFNGKRTKGSQGVHLKLVDSGSKTHTGARPVVRYIQFDRSSGEFKYPLGSKSSYNNNERVFIIGYVPEGRHYDISVKSDLDTGSNDFFLLTWHSGTTSDHYSFKYTGVNTYPARTVPHGTSYIMAFISDSTNTRSRSGVRVSYSNIDDSGDWHNF